jgi:site-specific recombinase XerD
MLEALQLRGLAPRTQPCDIEAVKHLSPRDRRAPDQLNEEAIRQYFLSLLNEKQVAERTFRIHLDGIRFFDEMTLQRPWPVLTLMRPRHSQQLPVVLSPQEGRSRLASVVNPKAGMCLRMIDAGGWRLREGTHLQVADLDPDRMLVRVRQGTGGQDRVVPLAARTLERWRVYWQRARPRPWWFPARDQQTPLPATTLQQTFTRVVRQRGLATDASIHTLRHSSATHRLERGISWRVIQALLGHQSPRTTARDTHLTRNTFDVVPATINALMADLSTCRSTGMPAVADVFRRDGPDDRARFGEHLLPSHRRAMAALIHGRTEAFGGHLWPCDHGGQEHDAYHACRHRRGPTSHHQDTEAWLEARRLELLPVPYCHAVLTLPHELGEVVRRHQQALDDSLLRAAAPALMTLAADPHDVGGLIGVLCVLHTRTRNLASHPHVHCLVPAGGVSADRTE